MTTPTNPPPVRLPEKIAQDPELRDWFHEFTRSVYFMWEKQKSLESRIEALEP